MLFKEYFFIAGSESQIKKRVLSERYQLKGHHKDLISKDMADFLSKCLEFNKKDRIKATEISKHPVFNKVKPKVEMLMESVLKSSGLDNSKIKSQGSKGRMLNFITSFNFIFDLAAKLSAVNPYNLATLYLHKFNYAELTSLKYQIDGKQNFLGLNDWATFSKSSDYAQVQTYFEKIYSLNKKAFEDSYNTILSAVAKKFGPQVAKGIEENLGKSPEDKMNPEIISYELMTNIVPNLRANNTP